MPRASSCRNASLYMAAIAMARSLGADIRVEPGARVVINTSVVVTPCRRLQVEQVLLDGGCAEFLVETPHDEYTEDVESKLAVRLFRLVSADKWNVAGADVLIFDLEAAIVGLCAITGDEGWGEHSETLDRKGGERMSLRYQRGQTGIAVLAFIVALVALGISVYTYFQVTQRTDMQTQLTRMQELVERGRQEIGDALKRLEEQLRGNQSRESPPRQ